MKQRCKRKQCEHSVLRHVQKREIKGNTVLSATCNQSPPKPSCLRFAPLR